MRRTGQLIIGHDWCQIDGHVEDVATRERTWCQVQRDDVILNDDARSVITAARASLRRALRDDARMFFLYAPSPAHQVLAVVAELVGVGGPVRTGERLRSAFLESDLSAMDAAVALMVEEVDHTAAGSFAEAS